MRDSLILSQRDLDFYLYDWLAIDELTDRTYFKEHSRETFDDVMALSRRIAVEHFAGHNKKSDNNEPSFDGQQVSIIPEVATALEKFADAGFIASSMPEDVGGMQLPYSVSSACFAWFAAANLATTGYMMLTIANANLLLAHGTQEQIDTYVGPMLEGRFFGTMCLSEPQAGSSLADVATRAVPAPDGTYRLYGNKMWISGGDQEISDNIVHLVLARVEGAPAGVKGLSLFIVPKYLVGQDGALGDRNDVVLAGLNHKMGQRGLPNTLLNFGEGAFEPSGSAGAIGYLVGEQNRGLSYMFHMMNEARIAVGLGAAVLGYTGYLHALDYARTRPQGRPVLAKDPTSPQVPIIEHPDVRRMLLLQKVYAEGAMGLTFYCTKLVDQELATDSETEREEASLLLELLTPITKSWPSQWCLEANSLAIQVHGGYGYTREYNVEQFYRDNRLNPIHEGTHGIQGLDLLGRKVLMADGAALRGLLARMETTAARAEASGGQLEVLGNKLRRYSGELAEVTAFLWGSGQFDVVLANASAYLEAFGDVVIGWIWLEQALATGTDDSEFAVGKRAAADFYFNSVLPRADVQFSQLRSLDRSFLDWDPSWF